MVDGWYYLGFLSAHVSAKMRMTMHDDDADDDDDNDNDNDDVEDDAYYLGYLSGHVSTGSERLWSRRHRNTLVDAHLEMMMIIMVKIVKLMIMNKMMKKMVLVLIIPGDMTATAQTPELRQ